jgi:hypothetical protein
MKELSAVSNQQSVKERPILFSTDMVKAILEGRKMMTRRILKNHIPIGNWDETLSKCPYGKQGDILWVRETWASYLSITDDWDTKDNRFYKADNKELPTGLKWKPSIHMPKSHARIWVKITDVQVERLLRISPQDSIKEGIAYFNDPLFDELRYKDYMDEKSNYRSPVSSFMSLWTSINGSDSVELDPWVWVVEFKVLSTTGKPDYLNS